MRRIMMVSAIGVLVLTGVLACYAGGVKAGRPLNEEEMFETQGREDVCCDSEMMWWDCHPNGWHVGDPMDECVICYQSEDEEGVGECEDEAKTFTGYTIPACAENWLVEDACEDGDDQTCYFWYDCASDWVTNMKCSGTYGTCSVSSSGWYCRSCESTGSPTQTVNVPRQNCPSWEE